MSDRARWIGRGGGYTTNVTRAVDRAEAVSEDVQEELTEQSHRAVIDEKLRKRTATRHELERERDYLESKLRYVSRQLKRLSRPV